jgi:hypothetical protein
MFKTIVADPPWPYKTPGQIGKTLEHRPNRDKTFASAAGAGMLPRTQNRTCSVAPRK